MHTSDVPAAYLAALSAVGWELTEVEYVTDVSSRCFRSSSRFFEVFTKLRVLQLKDLDLVLLLDTDLLVRDATEMATLFQLSPPAAMGSAGPRAPRLRLARARPPSALHGGLERPRAAPQGAAALPRPGVRHQRGRGAAAARPRGVRGDARRRGEGGGREVRGGTAGPRCGIECGATAT
ncbi:unnamed protein product [Prorocentrum cordatum]|uniref:Hexosyltransferase n=1 Tax=Prorocentrum cordatum TaxID=2364126 RepID=A0ABN9YDN8_9DINO|nr:unnamed protein product [Polarella glacialis]